MCNARLYGFAYGVLRVDWILAMRCFLQVWHGWGMLPVFIMVV